ncbi:ABC transporter ATP-binding protein [Phreatobacter oligotrophus]|jgi:putative spermidine/putrescine transport system ATP-binding protein|uniref:Spermidine/putrescine import ATP-binding protein PotA n=1 Tax=Phreatobacter oligotrophus TaxID=1122261 RepID=A0A2T4Z6D6_9HYPH|nr:ABC transporter ATP-binding protein [Phreatobacter oligotrophus]PTM57433.1 putative spermidine/putrescine transport system ATP-binding protein [Phreatobacter oligotrophus]
MIASASNPAAVRLEGLTKSYDGRHRAVDAIALDVKPGEFFSLLGPSGCGKTTTLRMIAGFETADEGRIVVGDTDVTDLAVHKRNMGMVFQSYALFPHRTVAENVAFGLRMRKVPRAEIEERVRAALAMVALTGFEDRRPGQLSGGQQQRVALARAIVIRPPVLLCDEPLGALDRKLRHQMQVELKQLQKELGVTLVFVTHDQEEALAMSDRIAVMNEGRIEQVGTPGDIYDRPRTRFVADFIGDINLIDQPDGRALALRPERIRLGEGPLAGKIETASFLGGQTLYRIALDDGRSLLAKENNPAGRPPRTIGERLSLGWDAADAVVLDA